MLISRLNKHWGVSRWAVLSLATFSLVGCDDSSIGDRSTLEKVDVALTQINSLETLAPGEGVQSVTTALTQAADAANGPAYKALAAGAAAAVDQQSVYAGLLKLNKQQAAVRRTLAELHALAGQVSGSNAYAIGYSKADPHPAVVELSSHITSMQGNAQNLTWGVSATPQLPTLAAVKAESSRLEGEIEQKQQQIATLTKQRDEAAATAEVQSKHADGLKGEEGVRAFAEASETRRKADDLTINIELVQVQLDRLKSDLALMQAQGGIVSTGITAQQEQGKALESDWVSTQKFADQQKKVATAAISGDKPSDYTVNAVATRLNTQLADLAATQLALLQQLEEAKTYAQTANQQASKFTQDLQPKTTGPGKTADAYKNLSQTVHPQQYQYRLGVVQRDIGTLSASQAALLRQVKAITDVAKVAVASVGVSVPDALEKIDTSSIETLDKTAEASLTEANETLTNVESGSTPERLKSVAKQARLVTLYTHLALLSHREAAGDAAAKTSATEMRSNAIALRDDLVATNTPLPPLPGELGQAPAPATQPAQ